MLRISWKTSHVVSFWILKRERNRWQKIRSKIDEQDRQSTEWKWNVSDDGQHEGGHFRKVTRQRVGN